MGLLRIIKREKKKGDPVSRYMRRERKEAKEGVPFRPTVVKIKGRRWEKVGDTRHGVSAVLVASYWKSMGFKTRIRRLKRGRKPKDQFSVDIKNFVTATDFPTIQKAKLAKEGKYFKVRPKSFKHFIKELKRTYLTKGLKKIF